MADYLVENHGTIYLFHAQNPEALKNLQDNVGAEAQWWGTMGSLVVEHRYARDLAGRLQEEGWEVE